MVTYKGTLCKKLWPWDYKLEFFPLQSDKTIIFLCLNVGGVARLH